MGFAVGPILAGILIDRAGWSISGVFGLSAGLSLATALLVTFGSREVRPEVIPEGRILDLAFGAVKGVISDPAVRRIFVIFGTAFLASQMSRPYIPVLVESVRGARSGLASAIGLVAGTAALAGALLAPFAGALGDRIGFRPVLVVALIGGGIALGFMPTLAPTGGVAGLAVLAVVVAASGAIVSSMVFGLLATEVPAERRSQTLNLVYLPLYAAGIIGPAARRDRGRLGRAARAVHRRRSRVPRRGRGGRAAAWAGRSGSDRPGVGAPGSGREVALRGADVAGIGPDDPVRRGLLDHVGRPAGVAREGERRREEVRREPDAHQHRRRVVLDVRLERPGPGASRPGRAARRPRPAIASSSHSGLCSIDSATLRSAAARGS